MTPDLWRWLATGLGGIVKMAEDFLAESQCPPVSMTALADMLHNSKRFANLVEKLVQRQRECASQTE